MSACNFPNLNETPRVETACQMGGVNSPQWTPTAVGTGPVGQQTRDAREILSEDNSSGLSFQRWTS